MVYWLLAIGSGSRHKETAYQFIRHCASAEGDRMTTLAGGIGCRMSTWTDPEVNRLIPFYHRLADLHAGTRMLPCSRNLPALVHIIDRAVHEAIGSDEPTASILARAQNAVASIRLED
jgi:multiple sugar transport system substrate-binding protein